MTERPVDPQDYGTSTADRTSTSPQTDSPAREASPAAERTSSAGPPPSANQSKAEPDPAAAEANQSGDDAAGNEPNGDAAATLAASPPAATRPSDHAGRTALAVPGRPDGEVDTTR